MISGLQRALQGESGRRDAVSDGSKELRTCVAGLAEEAPRQPANSAMCGRIEVMG